MIRKFGKWEPKISKDAIIDDSAMIIGNVIVGKASVWPGVIIRADENKVEIKDNVAILDKAFIEGHEDVIIGEGSVISHGAILHGSKIGKNVLVGMGAIVLEVSVGDNSIIAAGSVVIEDIEANSFVAGIPAKKIKDAGEDAEKTIKMAISLYEKAKWLK